jgi:hypothetical protein
MDYSVNVSTAGSYTINLRVATPYFGAQFQIRNSGGTVLATVNLPVTGGFQTWQTISAVVNLGAGTQTIRLQSSASAGWNINWLEIVGGATPSNQPPTVSAGADKTITLPTNSVSLTGSATDADGTIASYAWSKISGGSATITSPSNASTTITGLVQGSYTFRLTATDNKGAIASDDVLITVNAQPTPVFSLRIEAESFSSASSVTRQPTQDIDGTEELSSLDNGDWMQYLVNVPYAGTYTVSFRVASTKGGSKFQLLNAAGSLLTTANLPNTGSLQNWQTVSVQATLEQGTQTFKILVNKASGNPTFNWWNISLVNTNTGRINNSLVQELPASKELFVYPSPFRDHFVLELNNAYSGPMKIQIVNTVGAVQKEFRLIKTAGISRNLLSLNNLPKGEYILIVYINGEKETRKIIKL